MSSRELREGSKPVSKDRSKASASNRTHIGSACIACRQRRCKCSGGTPCQKCATLGTECIYSGSGDKRTRVAREKEREELDILKKVVDAVFRAIRGDDTFGVLELIRQNASISEIASVLDQDTSPGEHMDAESNDPETGHEQSPFSPEGSRQRPSTSEIMVSNLKRSSESPSEYGSVASRQGLLTALSPQLATSSTMARIDAEPPLAIGSDQVEPRYALQILHEDDNSPLGYLSSLYIKFRDASHHILDQTVPNAKLNWSSPVSCAMLFRDRESSDLFSISTWAAAVVNSSPELDLLFRLAWLVMLTRFMRWSILMCRESFIRLPDLMRPTTLQLSVAHPPYIDLAPMPHIRDAMILKQNDFTSAFRTAGASINWNAPLEDAVHHDPINGVTVVTERFERHVANASNYWFGRRFLEFFPELEGKVNVAAEDFIPPTAVPAETLRRLAGPIMR